MPRWAQVILIQAAAAALLVPATGAQRLAVAAPQELGSLPISRLTPSRPTPRSGSIEAAQRALPDSDHAPQPLRGFGVRIVEPAHDAYVGGKVEIRAEVRADRPEEVLFVEFAVDARVLFADAKPPYELVWQAREAAAHRITARAYGPTGQVVEDVVYTRVPPAYTGAASFRSRVERVEVYVRIENSRISGQRLGVADFAVLENDVEQPIVAVERSSDLPLTVGLMVDCSGSMLDKLGFVLDTAGSFIDGLMTSSQDMAFVMSFADLPSMLQEFTNDSRRLSDALELIDSGRYTRLFDSVVAASREFRGHEGRRALILLTDGHDANSDADLAAAIEAAQRADVALYPVAVDVTPRFFYERWVLERLARATGGRVSYLETLDDPERIYGAIAEDLRDQYRITYEPVLVGGDGEWRPIEVRVAAGRVARRARVRARPGYFAE